MMDNDLEFDFFKILVLSVILGQPKFFIDKLMKKDPLEMFLRAKGLIDNGLKKLIEPNKS